MSAVGACPECQLPTIRRVYGEWCPRCRGFVTEVKLFWSADQNSDRGSGLVRVIARHDL